MFDLGNTFDEVAEKIEEENKLEKLLEIKSEKELYDFFKENGYSKSEGEFKADIEKLIAENSISLEGSELDEIAGGTFKDNLTKLTSAGVASLLALGASSISSKAHASDVYHFTEFQPTSIQKSSQKGGSKAKKIILGTIAGIAGLDAVAIGVMGCVGYREGIANMANKIKMLKEELNEMSETAESYGTDLSSKVEKCIDNLKDIEDTCLLSVKERKFETLKKMVEGVKKDFQDAKDKRAQEENQAKAKAEAEAEQKVKEEKQKLEEERKAQEKVKKEEEERKAKEQQAKAKEEERKAKEQQAKAKEEEQKAREKKRKLEEERKAQEKVKKEEEERKAKEQLEKEEAEHQKALEIERKQKQIDKLKVEIEETKKYFEQYQELNSNSGKYFDQDVASYLESTIKILGDLKDNINFSNFYEVLGQISEIVNEFDEVYFIVSGAQYDIIFDDLGNTLDRADGRVSDLESYVCGYNMLLARQEIQEIKRMFEEYNSLRQRNYSELRDSAEAELQKRVALLKDINLHFNTLNDLI